MRISTPAHVKITYQTLYAQKFFTLFLSANYCGLVYHASGKSIVKCRVGRFFYFYFIQPINLDSFKASKINISLLVFCGVYLLHLSHFFCTENINMPHYLAVIFMKLPLLLLPLGFILLPGLSKREFQTLLYLFFAITVVTSLGSVANYIIHFEEINILYLTSKALPVAANHVRYSLMLATAICAGAYLFISKFSFGIWKHERKLLLFFIAFLFAFAHLLAVRSGLVALYATCFIAGIAGCADFQKKENCHYSSLSINNPSNHWGNHSSYYKKQGGKHCDRFVSY